MLTPPPDPPSLLNSRYRRHLTDSLRKDRLGHWDPEIRRLAAEALHNITPLEPSYAADVVLPAALRDSLSPDLVKRDGACRAAASVSLSLGKVRLRFPPLPPLKNIVWLLPCRVTRRVRLFGASAYTC